MKGPQAFRTISEAADELGVPQHVLRFWETKFSFIRPMKRAGGRRFYRPQDLTVLKGVRALLHGQGHTIKGVQQLHREHGVKVLLAAAEGGVIAEPLLAPAFDEGVLEMGGLDGVDAAENAESLSLDRVPATPPTAAAARQRLHDALADLEAAKARLTMALRAG